MNSRSNVTAFPPSFGNQLNETEMKVERIKIEVPKWLILWIKRKTKSGRKNDEEIKSHRKLISTGNKWFPIHCWDVISFLLFSWLYPHRSLFTFLCVSLIFLGAHNFVFFIFIFCSQKESWDREKIMKRKEKRLWIQKEMKIIKTDLWIHRHFSLLISIFSPWLLSWGSFSIILFSLYSGRSKSFSAPHFFLLVFFAL